MQWFTPAAHQHRSRSCAGINRLLFGDVTRPNPSSAMSIAKKLHFLQCFNQSHFTWPFHEKSSPPDPRLSMHTLLILNIHFIYLERSPNQLFFHFAVSFAVKRVAGLQRSRIEAGLGGRAEEVGFEPTKAIHLTRFPVVLTRPL